MEGGLQVNDTPPHRMSPSRRSIYIRRLPWLATGLALASAGSLTSRIVNPLPVTEYSTTTLGLWYGGMFVGAGACLWWRRVLNGRAHRSVSLAKPSAPAARDGSSSAESAPVPVASTTQPIVEAADHPFLRRVRSVLPETIVVPAVGLEIDDADVCQQFVLQTKTPGEFATERMQQYVYEKVSKSVGGNWSLTVQTERDMLQFARKARFPGAIAPPLPERVAQSTIDALDIYPSYRVLLGVDAGGERLEIDPSKFPHTLIVGGTGSGKSVFIRGLIIELARAAGWQIGVGDGKTTDYESMNGENNIIAVSQSAADHVRLVRMFVDELHARQADAKTRKRQRLSNPFQRPPMMLLLDEYATMRAHVESMYSKEGLKKFVEDLKELTRVGREFKIHVVIATQEVYRETIDGQLLGNIGLRISLGVPADKTIKEAFPDQLRTVASRIGGTISSNDRGRGIALLTDEKEGINKAVEFQSFYGYSPGESKPPPPPLVEAWAEFRTQISERIPKLYPRVWWKVEDPEYGDDLDTLYSLPPVLLDGPRGEPDPKAFIYDPLHEDYLGSDKTGTSQPPLPDLSELASGTVFNPRPAAQVQPPRRDEYVDRDDEEHNGDSPDDDQPDRERRLPNDDERDVEHPIDNAPVIDSSEPDESDSERSHGEAEPPAAPTPKRVFQHGHVNI